MLNQGNVENKNFRRYLKRDKQIKKKRKDLEKEKRYVEDYDDFMISNLIKEFYTTKSPHLLISRKWFKK